MKISYMYFVSIIVFFGFSTEVSAVDLPTNADKQIVRITSEGFFPKNITLEKLDSSVFFFNETGKSIDKFSIDFGKKRIHCHNPSLDLGDDGVLRSSQPILPNSFVIACFPDPANYPIAASFSSKKYAGSVIVPETQTGDSK